jgi:SAM-dependent methyltransferase
MTESAPATSLPPPVQMLQMVIVGRQIAHAVAVAARLDLATLVGGGTRSVAELAERSGSNSDALHRLMRALASVGVFVENEPGRFGNTPLSETLRSDAPASSRPLALFFGHDCHVQAWLGLEYSVRTGKSGFEHIHGAAPFEYVARHPEVASVFNDAMTAFSAAHGPAVADAYDFSAIDRLVDVGGGQGQLLAAIVARYPGVRGVLFDLPHVVAGAPAVIEGAGLASRIEIVGGDFFQSVPAAGAYLMKSVLHDWSDADARRILESIHRAATPGARLLIAEAVLEPGNHPDIAKFMDLEMLVATNGGRERNEAEWRALLAAGGFRLERVIATASPLRLLVAARA